LGLVKNATKEAMVNLDICKEKITVKAYATAKYPNASVLVFALGNKIIDETFDFHPGNSYEKSLEVPAGIDPEQFYIVVKSADGKILVDWQSETNKAEEIPQPAQAAKTPNEIESNEQLYLTGLHLEQYRHATYDPRDYYEEALRRDSLDSRCNNALGL
jgi:hypothetical protein